MSRSQFQSEMDHISSSLYFGLRRVQTCTALISVILEKQHLDEVSLEELSENIKEIRELNDTIAGLADDVVQVRCTYEGILQA